ncbi:hypothetical protein IAT38_001528 [Cryptococcus sp. DSM 104549]
MSLRSVLDPKTKLSASSTTSGSSKKHLLSPDSTSGENPPWSSNAPCSLSLSFPSPTPATHIALTFQGGFVGTSIAVWVARTEKAEKTVEGVGLGLMLGGKIYPEDRNRRQVFEIPFPPSGISPTTSPSTGPKIITEVPADGTAPVEDDGVDLPLITELKLEFEKSSDQYGRITLYSLEVLGE